ncbi:MAG TPA: zinc-ribbon domain and TM2 domain-containing protein [Fervidobacterium nodosum]|nr:zinc-ribbon domain and TM2 domain-containing protein [Fervidobacterium nodosum]
MSKYCLQCGKELPDNCKYCPSCGAYVLSLKPRKSPIIAALLALFLGGVGAHRFYLGQWWGIIYIVFCWTYIPMIIAAIEGIYWLFHQKEFLDKYG